jgi:hypothetical protein
VKLVKAEDLKPHQRAQLAAIVTRHSQFYFRLVKRMQRLGFVDSDPVYQRAEVICGTAIARPCERAISLLRLLDMVDAEHDLSIRLVWRIGSDIKTLLVCRRLHKKHAQSRGRQTLSRSKK